MLIRITNGALRSSLWLLAAAIVLLAIYLLLGRAFVYSIADNKKSIEALLNDGDSQHVTIGEAVGDWRAFDPVFTLFDVHLVDGGEDIVQLASLRVRLDSFGSLIRRSPMVSEIEVRGVSFTVVVDGDGIRVKGLTLGGGDFNSEWLLDNVQHVNRVVLSDVDVAVEGFNDRVHIRSREGEPWKISGNSAMKLVMFPVYMVHEHRTEIRENRLNLTGRYRGDIRTDDFSTRLYLGVSTLELANYLPDVRFGNQLVTAASLSSEIWIDATPNQVSLVGDLTLSSVLSQRETHTETLLDQGDLQFRYEGPTLLSGSLSIPLLELIQGELKYRLTDISVALEVGSEAVAVAAEIPVVDVDDLAGLLQFAGNKQFIPREVSSALNIINPSGKLQDIAFLFDRSRGESVIAGRLAGFSMDAYRGVPAIAPLNGFLMARPARGFLDIDNAAFVMNFSNMFSEPWPFDSGRGRVAYEISGEELKVESGLIELSHGDLEAFGKAVWNLPSVRDLQSWGLTIGISNAELLDSQKFIPNLTSDSLVHWLKSAIRTGQSNETGLTFHGALFRGSDKVRKAHDLFFKIGDSQVKYHLDWPPIREAHGTVHITNHFIRSNDLIGRVYDTSVEKAQLDVPLNANGRADMILVNASSVGPLSDLIRTLNETPLSDTTANAAELWQGSGEILAEMALNVPIGDRTGEAVVTAVVTSFTDADLRMPEFDLRVTELSGVAEFSTKDGLSSNGFSGVSFQEPIEGSIVTAMYDTGGEIKVSVNGAISSASLYEWSDQVLLSRADGKLDYTVVVHVPYGDAGDEAYVEAHTDLAGMSLNLPYPLGKPASDESRRLQYNQYFGEDSYRIGMTLDENIKASLKVVDGIAVGGLIHFGDEPLGDVSYDQVRVTGQLSYLDVEQWLKAIDELGEVTDVSLNNEIAANVESVLLSIDKLQLYELELERSRARVARNDAAWLTSLESDMLKGDISVADADDLPIEIRLERLRIDDSDNAANSLGDVQPLEIDDINFYTDSLIVDDEAYGSWAFHYRVDDKIARFEEIQAMAAGLRILPSSTLEWRTTNGVHSTRFTGDIEIEDLATAMQKFGFASSIEGQGLKIDADVMWAGSPVMVDVERLVGNVGIHEGEGRFVQAETGGALKLLGIFDFASIARRLRLDFSDVVEKGFEFTEISGLTAFNQGHVGMTQPIVIEGSTGRFTVGGDVDLKAGTLNNEMIVTLPVTRTLPWYAAYSAIAAGPLSGVGVMIAQKVFENQIDQMSSAKYKISGTIDEPAIEFVAIFNDKLAETSVEQSEVQP